MIEMRGIHKSFPGVHALKGVNFDLHEGEVHCLVGENGAGKSTLIKILSGVYHPDEGEIYFFGQKIRKINPYIAREMGISFIYQELDLFPFLTVGENIFLGSEPCSRLGRVNWKKLYCGSVQILDSLNFPLDVKTKVGNLTVAERQMVAVAKALCRKSKVLVMDEPSAVLSGKELDVLFDNIKRLKEEGVGIIYISHRLEEIFEIGDRVTVLRDGRCIDTAKVKDVTVQEITRKMVGREVKLYKKSLNSEVSLNREKIILSVVGTRS
ncbi:D-xylose ABC transporter ATP-binding protein, partial [Candidatus Aerophobetes bacterium]